MTQQVSDDETGEDGGQGEHVLPTGLFKIHMIDPARWHPLPRHGTRHRRVGALYLPTLVLCGLIIIPRSQSWAINFSSIADPLGGTGNNR
jgi:hypothetical protein